MSEYEFGNMPYLESYSGSDNLLSFFQDKNFLKVQMKPDLMHTAKQTIMPTEDSVIGNKMIIDQVNTTPKIRPKRKIECSMQKKICLKKNYRGNADQTIELNTNFKTIMCNFLKQMIYLRQVNEKDLENIQEFKKSVPSFQAFHQFLKKDNSNSQLRVKCLEFVSSSKIIKQILVSRAKQPSKLRMLKYIEVLRRNIEENGQNFIRWKTLNKHKVQSI